MSNAKLNFYRSLSSDRLEAKLLDMADRVKADGMTDSRADCIRAMVQVVEEVANKVTGSGIKEAYCNRYLVPAARALVA